jgi:chromosome segregation ATPase
MTDSEYPRLVEFLTRQFAEIDRRFSAMDHRFIEVGHRFTALEDRFRESERRSGEQFREILGHFDELYRRLERLEAEYFAIVQTLRRIETLVGSEQAQREALGQSVDQLRRQIAELQARLDAVEARLRG